MTPSDPPATQRLLFRFQGTLKAGAFLEKDEILTVRVLRPLPDGNHLVHVKGKILTAEAEGLKSGESFNVRVTSLHPEVVMERVRGNEGQDLLSAPAASYSGDALEGMRNAILQALPLLDAVPDNRLARQLTSLASSMKRLLDPAHPSPEGLEALFGLVGVKEGLLDAILDGLNPDSVGKRLTEIVADENAGFKKWADLGLGSPLTENLQKGLAALLRVIESLRSSNNVLYKIEGGLYLRWMPLSFESGPLRIYLKRDAVPQGKKPRLGRSFTAEMSVELPKLGEIRARLLYGPTLDLTLKASEDAAARLSKYESALAEGLAFLGRPVRIAFRTLFPDEPPFPDVTYLVARAKGGAGRMNVTA